MNGGVDTTLVGLQTAPQAQVGALAGKAKGAMTTARMRKVAQDFEAVFISEMIRPMFENIEAEKPFGGGPAEDIWRNLQIDEYGKAISKSGGVGIADAVMDQLIRMQETR
ncbi:MAG: rod-binding protein [Rhodospirillales bacterium]